MLQEVFDKAFDTITRKTIKKSGKTVKKEVKKKIDEATTGQNAQKLLIVSLVMSVGALIFGLARSNKPVIVNVYNGVGGMR